MTRAILSFVDDRSVVSFDDSDSTMVKHVVLLSSQSSFSFAAKSPFLAHAIFQYANSPACRSSGGVVKEKGNVVDRIVTQHVKG
ncbi:hypothetical protein [Bradyrhizobium macuxiense]|uniref:hypothetical protein n=1 Tax=Bradyrhizobium macuxiense TaxID=1755647 RepID=UPI000AF017FF|nr:hypothetical protein [Bradyrhizobium macuxiense]